MNEKTISDNVKTNEHETFVYETGTECSKWL